MGTAGLGVEEEGVITAIPGHIHEPHQQPVGDPGGDPAETVPADPTPPPASGRPPSERTNSTISSSVTGSRHRYEGSSGIVAACTMGPLRIDAPSCGQPEA